MVTTEPATSEPHTYQAHHLTYRQNTSMESKAGAAVTISESDLSKSVKNLKATKGREHTDSLEFDTQIADKLGE